VNEVIREQHPSLPFKVFESPDSPVCFGFRTI